MTSSSSSRQRKLLSIHRRGAVPGGTERNWESYRGLVGDITDEQRLAC
jgi:selenophosphate synthase